MGESLVHGIDTLGYAGFTARDIAAWKTFGPGVLGLQLSEELADGTLVFRADRHRRRIVIHPGATDGVAYLGWECSGPEGLENVRKALRAAGTEFEDVAPEVAAQSCVRAMIRFRDADGVVGEAYYGPTLLVDQPFISPVGAGPFVMDDQGLGHAVLATERYKEQIAFYENVLSFRITDYVNIAHLDREGAFLRVNRRHHSLALLDIPVTHGNFHHLLLQMSSLDDVGFAYKRAKEAGAHILIDFGRHVNDNMFSFYVTTPSGWAVEIGWGGLNIDEDSWHVTNYPVNSSWGHEYTPAPPAA